MGTKIRLQAIFNMINTPCIAADIGCDHGMLPIALVKHKKCVKAYACDVRKAPLERAKKAIAEAGEQEHVIPILCDGLSLLPDDVTTIIIAGMGFDTITHILQQDMNKMPKFKQIVIQCNGKVDDFRKWLSDNGFRIDDECIVKDHHFYQLISMHFEPSYTLSDKQCIFGVNLNKDPLYHEYWNHVCQKKKHILQKMKVEHENYKKIKKYIDLIEDELNNI